MVKSLLKTKSAAAVAKDKTAARRAKFAKGSDKHIGNEPTPIDVTDNASYIGALNWYNYMYDVEKARTYLLDYLKLKGGSRHQIEAVRRANKNNIPSTIGWQARMMLNGISLSEDSKQFFNDKLQALCAADVAPVETETSADASVKPTIADRVKAKLNDAIADIEDIIDAFVANNYSSDFDFYKYLQAANIKADQANKIANHYAPLCSELEMVLSKEDEQLVEAYSKFKTANIKKYLEFIEKIVSNAQSLANVKKAARTLRKPKEKSAIQLTAKMKYLKESTPFKIASIDPTKIIKAQTLVIFNTKYRKLGIYYAATDAGFSVKGTTITNYDEAKSMSKIIRKPEAVLPLALSKSKMQLNKMFAEIKSTGTILNGRINEDTIILRVL